MTDYQRQAWIRNKGGALILIGIGFLFISLNIALWLSWAIGWKLGLSAIALIITGQFVKENAVELQDSFWEDEDDD
jgi:hypothetical protein